MPRVGGHAEIDLRRTLAAEPVVLRQAPGAGQSTFVMYRSDKTVCTNWGGYTLFHVGANALSVRRGLLRFDVSSLPR